MNYSGNKTLCDEVGAGSKDGRDSGMANVNGDKEPVKTKAKPGIGVFCSVGLHNCFVDMFLALHSTCTFTHVTYIIIQM